MHNNLQIWRSSCLNRQSSILESIIPHNLKKFDLVDNHLLLSLISFNDPDYVFCLLNFAYYKGVCGILITSQKIGLENHWFIYHNLVSSSQVTRSFVNCFWLWICLFYVHAVTRVLHNHAKFKHQNNFAELRPWQWKIPLPLLQQKLCCVAKLYYGGQNHVCSSGIVVTKEEYPTAWFASCCVSRLRFSAVGSVSVIYCSRNH